MTQERGYVCRTFRYEDEEDVKRLVKNAFGDFLGGEFWDWKYKLNPGFDPSLVAVAEKDGAIIGCNHWLLKNLKLTPRLVTKAVLGADVAVDPDFRGKGVGKSLLLYQRSSGIIEKEKPSIIYMFANPSLAEHFHIPVGGFIPTPDRTVFYFKILNWKRLEEKVELLNAQIAAGKFGDRLSKLGLRVLFEFSGAPSICFSIGERGIIVEKDEQNWRKNVDVTIAGDLTTFQEVAGKRNRRLKVFKALLLRRIKIGGRPRKLIRFYRNSWMFEEIYRILT
jgi:GNAT superfamily N-acetyltransferase